MGIVYRLVDFGESQWRIKNPRHGLTGIPGFEPFQQIDFNQFTVCGLANAFDNPGDQSLFAPVAPDQISNILAWRRTNAIIAHPIVNEAAQFTRQGNIQTMAPGVTSTFRLSQSL